jgi:hypothetical protein
MFFSGFLRRRRLHYDGLGYNLSDSLENNFKKCDSIGKNNPFLRAKCNEPVSNMTEASYYGRTRDKIERDSLTHSCKICQTPPKMNVGVKKCTAASKK